MLQVNKETIGDELIAQIIGDLNVKTSPQFEEDLTKSIGGVKNLVWNFAFLQIMHIKG